MKRLSLIATWLLCFFWVAPAAFAEIIKVSTVEALQKAATGVKEGTTIRMEDGVYANVKLIVTGNGTEKSPVVIEAANPGKVFFTGDVKVELRGDYVTLSGVYFKDGSRNQKEWKSHGPGLVAIYGSHCRVTDCLFYRFDDANSAYITTSLDENGEVPQYCRIDHCAFIEKATLDQVINLNNTPKKMDEGEPGIPMYHRIDHCYFSNPPKKGNAGGGIRVGYWRKDFGRCLIDNNVFERQDSEAEIVTSKSRENVYYNNLFINCRGTLNFRHGDDQVALCNSFLSTDGMYGYGGMYIWGSGHLVANNYFNLQSTLKDRGNAAMYFNVGPKASEHALAYDIQVIKNVFENIEGEDLHLAPHRERREESFGKERVELPHDIWFTENLFIGKPNKKFTVVNNMHDNVKANHWINNYYMGLETGIAQQIQGLDNAKLQRNTKSKSLQFMGYKPLTVKDLITEKVKSKIEGIDLNFREIIASGQTGATIRKTDVGPAWATDQLPGDYAKTGKWTLPIAGKSK